MGERQVSANFIISEEVWAMSQGFARKGHIEHDPITAQDRKDYALVQEALQIVSDSPWVDLYEFDYTLKPLERKRFVPEETPEEYVARYREAKANGWKPPEIDWRSWT